MQSFFLGAFPSPPAKRHRHLLDQPCNSTQSNHYIDCRYPRQDRFIFFVTIYSPTAVDQYGDGSTANSQQETPNFQVNYNGDDNGNDKRPGGPVRY
jgi:hypothetical protein